MAPPARAARVGTGGAIGAGGTPTTIGQGGFIGTGVVPLVPEFTDDFEDGSFTAPPVKWLSTAYNLDPTTYSWSIATDGTKVASQTMASDETELVSGDYRWKDASIEAKVKLITPDNRAGVCVRYKSVRDKYCIYLEQLVDERRRRRLDHGDAHALRPGQRQQPAQGANEGPGDADPGVSHRLEHGEARGPRHHVHGVAERDDGLPVQRPRRTWSTAGGVALATNNGGIAEFDDATATPF